MILDLHCEDLDSAVKPKKIIEVRAGAKIEQGDPIWLGKDGLAYPYRPEREVIERIMAV